MSTHTVLAVPTAAHNSVYTHTTLSVPTAAHSNVSTHSTCCAYSCTCYVTFEFFSLFQVFLPSPSQFSYMNISDSTKHQTYLNMNNKNFLAVLPCRLESTCGRFEGTKRSSVRHPIRSERVFCSTSVSACNPVCPHKHHLPTRSAIPHHTTPPTPSATSKYPDTKFPMCNKIFLPL